MTGANFLKAYLRDYRIGAATVSTKYVIRKIIRQLKPEYKFIVEYGAGDGVVTKEILRTLPPDGRVVAIEINEALLKELRKIQDSRLTVVSGDIRELSGKLSALGLPRIDAVISNVPLTFFSPDVREAIIAHAYHALVPGGRLIVYQYSTLVLPALRRVADRRVRVFLELRNFLPYFVMVAEKV